MDGANSLPGMEAELSIPAGPRPGSASSDTFALQLHLLLFSLAAAAVPEPIFELPHLPLPWGEICPTATESTTRPGFLSQFADISRAASILYQLECWS